MLHLPTHLAEVEGEQHTLYTDITISATQGNLGELEERLQTAANIHCKKFSRNFTVTMTANS